MMSDYERYYGRKRYEEAVAMSDRAGRITQLMRDLIQTMKGG